jgi:hypothetical protein
MFCLYYTIPLSEVFMTECQPFFLDSLLGISIIDDTSTLGNVKTTTPAQL